MHPYRVTVQPGEAADATLVVRNFLAVPTVYAITIVPPPGVRFDPAVATLRVEPGGVRRLPVRVSAARDVARGPALVCRAEEPHPLDACTLVQGHGQPVPCAAIARLHSTPWIGSA